MHKKLVFPLWFVLTDEPGTPTSGNPISYFNGTRWDFTWQNGRQLATASTEGKEITYSYDLNGLRTSKTVTYTTTEDSGGEEHTHDYTTTVTAPTCLNAGYTTYTCSCGDSYTGNVVDALGHNYVESETETGSVFTCSRCGDSYTGHQHTYTGSVVAPTCTMQGYTIYTCSCGDSYNGNIVPALGHDGVAVGQTETMITYLCNRCGATYQEPIVVDPNPPVEMSLRSSTATTEHHEYIYASGQLLREVITTTANGNTTTQTLDFTYDASGYPYALTYTNGTASPVTYYYVTNMQGDVVKLVSASGTTVASYTYDAWGKILSSEGDMAEVNPIRYRGYYYDAEIGMYYLQSRYYDPTVKRFINADGIASTGQGFLGYNMFAYCNNDPIIFADRNGYDAYIIIDNDSASGNGHVCIIVQDEDGNWWYYSFAAERTGRVTNIITAVNSSLTLTLFSPLATGGVKGALDYANLGKADGYDLTNLADFKEFLSTYAPDTASGMDCVIQLQGDFTATAKACEKRQDRFMIYNLYHYNCMDFAVEMLLKGDGLSRKQRWTLYMLREHTIPNMAQGLFESLGEVMTGGG